MKSLSILLFSALCAMNCMAQTPADSAKVIQIINKSEEAYAHIKTYADSGKLIQTMITDRVPSKTALIFKTAYTSTGDFNFEYYKMGESNSLYTINRTGNEVKTWWGITNKEQTPTSISHALYTAAGVSSSTSTLIPALLMRVDFKGQNFYRQLKTHTLEGEEQINGVACYKIKGNGVYGASVIWIAKKDYLIRRLDLENTVDPAKSEARARALTEEMKTKDSVRYKAMVKTNKLIADVNKRDSLRGAPRRPFVVKDTYTFNPVIDHKINPELLKYRPNREVAL